MSDAGTPAAPALARWYISLDTGWLFGGAYQSGSEAPGAPTTGWAPVSVPHCVVPLSWCNWDPATWQKRWVYRRAFEVPAGTTGKKIFLDFEGSMTTTTPVVNGTTLLEAKGGYLPFSRDVTNLVHPGTNQLALIVDGTWQPVPPDGNTKVSAGQNVAASIDYLEPAGLYRHVGLRLVPTPAYLNGVFVDPSAPSDGPVTVPVVVQVQTTSAVEGYVVSATLRAWGSADGHSHHLRSQVLGPRSRPVAGHAVVRRGPWSASLGRWPAQPVLRRRQLGRRCGRGRRADHPDRVPRG